MATGQDNTDVEDEVVPGRFRSSVHALITGNNYYSLLYRSDVCDPSVTRARRFMIIMSITTTIFGLNSIWVWMDTQGNILPQINVFVIAFITSFLSHYFNQIFVFLYSIVRPFEIFRNGVWDLKKKPQTKTEIELADRLVSSPRDDTATSTPYTPKSPELPKSYLERKDTYRYRFLAYADKRYLDEIELDFGHTRKPFTLESYPWEHITREGRIRVQKYAYYTHPEMLDEAKRDLDKHIDQHKEANFKEHPNLWTHFEDSDTDTYSDWQMPKVGSLCNPTYKRIPKAIKRIDERLEKRKRLREKREMFSITRVKNAILRFRLDMRSFMDDLDDKCDRYERSNLKGCCQSVAKITGDHIWFFLFWFFFTICYFTVCMVPCLLWGLYFQQYTWNLYMLAGMITAFILGYIILMLALHYRSKFSVYNVEKDKKWNNLNLCRIITGIIIVVFLTIMIIIPLVLYFTTTVFQNSDVTYFALTLCGIIILILCVSAYFALSWRGPWKDPNDNGQPLPWWFAIPVDGMVLGNVGAWLGCCCAFAVAFNDSNINSFWAYNSIITITVDVLLFETVFMPIMRLLAYLTIVPSLKSDQYTE
jgi:hypothetical protein